MKRTSGKEDLNPLPPGNQWEYSERNTDLTPSNFPLHITSLSEALRRLVDGIQQQYLANGWEFTDAVGKVFENRRRGLRTQYKQLAIVYTHPKSVKVYDSDEMDDLFRDREKLLKPELINDDGDDYEHLYDFSLLPRPINKLLRGTNLVTYYAGASYNGVKIQCEDRESKTFVQSGVAYIDLGLQRIDDRIAYLDRRISGLNRSIRNRMVRWGQEKVMLRGLRYEPSVSLLDESLIE